MTKEDFLNSFSTAYIFGGGSSGQSVAKLLKKYGKKNILIDQIKQVGSYDEFFQDDHVLQMDSNSIIVKSPGISPDHPILKDAVEKKIRVFSEIDIGVIFFQGKIIGITGTDGKSTSTCLVNHLITKDFPNCKAAGNLSPPFTSICEENLDFATLELSSYQLEDSMPIPVVSCAFLNLAEDHLERHKTMENYFTAKMRILGNSSIEKFFIVNDSILKKYPNLQINCKFKVFGYDSTSDARIDLEKNLIETSTFKYSTTHFPLQGKHNLENLAASILIAESVGCSQKNIQERLQTFHGLSHRFEFVRKINNLVFINDSKSTNLHSMLAGLRGVDEKKMFILVIGGRPKKESITPMLERFKSLNMTVFLLGEAIHEWSFALGEILGKNLVVGNSIEEVVQSGYELAKRNGVELFIFSPACSSFDRYKNFEERGEHFKSLVNRL